MWFHWCASVYYRIMKYTTLGRTGLRVSVAGLGCGGNSRLGQGVGKSPEDAAALVRDALDAGITYFDTAHSYGTEPVLGRAIPAALRDSVMISTKARVAQGSPDAAASVVASLDQSLRDLNTDHVDVFMFHGVPPHRYAYVRDNLVPVALAEKEKGKFRFLGISETPPNDPDQRMLAQALPEGIWDVALLGFHMMNQVARQVAFPLTRRYGTGAVLMFVVRNIFSKPGRLADTMRGLAARGQVPAALADDPDPLAFLVHDSGAASLQDAAYRFARYEPGVDVVLFGTGDREHLRANVASILAPPLPPTDVARLNALFADLRGVGLDGSGHNEALPSR